MKAFVEDYCRHFNATRAAKAAHYSEKTAYSQGQRLLKNVEIQEAIKARIAELTMGEDEFMVRMAEDARADMGDFATIRPRMSQEHLDPDDPNSELIWVRSQELEIRPEAIKKQGRIVKRLSMNKYGPSIELVDALAARIKIGEMMGKFVSKHEIKHEIDWSTLTEEQLKRIVEGEDVNLIIADQG
jgi:phage terminase small subunit